MRKRRDRSVPGVENLRIKRSSAVPKKTSNEEGSSTDGQVKQKSCIGFGLPNYLPEMPCSEDAASTSKHKDILIKEHSKSNPNAGIIHAVVFL